MNSEITPEINDTNNKYRNSQIKYADVCIEIEDCKQKVKKLKENLKIAEKYLKTAEIKRIKLLQYREDCCSRFEDLFYSTT